MALAPFAYRVAHTVEEALELLRTHGDAKVLSGGQSLIPALKLRLTSPPMLIDISRIPGIGAISRENGTLHIGATAPHRQVEKSAVVKEASPVLAAVAHQIGDVQVRHRGTFGGSLVHADPAADWPAGALAAEATMVIAGPHGTRTIPATEFFTGMLTSAVGPDELLLEVRVPANGAPGTYRKQRNAASGYATVGVAATPWSARTGRSKATRSASPAPSNQFWSRGKIADADRTANASGWSTAGGVVPSSRSAFTAASTVFRI